MAVSPTGKPPAPLQPLKAGGNRISETERADREAREARARIEDSQRQVRDAEREASIRIDHLRDGHAGQVEAESIRQEAAIEAEKTRGYAALRQLKQAQQAELNRVRREGERELAQVKDYYRNTIHSTDRRGSEELAAIESRQETERSFNEMAHAQDMDAQRTNAAFELERLKADKDSKYADLQRQAHDDYVLQKEKTTAAKARSEEQFHEKFHSVQSGHKSTIRDVESRAVQDIRRVRQDTAAKIAAYSARQDDPFYKMVDVDASLSDEGDAFVLTATIPEHERDHVSVTVRGNEVVLSGTRRNEEKLGLGPGRMKRTDSYQSFHESFPIDWPVDARAMTRVFDGDELVVTLPKKSALARAEERQKPMVSRARQERPRFPENLAVSKYRAQAESGEKADLTPPEVTDDTPPTRKRATRTLA